MNVLPLTWETERLTVRDVGEADVDALTALFNANAHVGKWDRVFHAVERDELRDLVIKSMGRAQRPEAPFQMQCAQRKGDGALVAYFHAVYGVPPAPDAVYISMFVVDPALHGQGYGAEIVRGLSEQWPRCLPGHARAWAEVSLKNWPALRFWIAAGFRTIVEWDGDREWAENAHATLILEKLWG